MSELNEQLTVLSDQLDALIRIIDSNAQVMQIAKRRIAQLESENRELREKIARFEGQSFVVSVTYQRPTLEAMDNGRECATGPFLRDAANMEKE